MVGGSELSISRIEETELVARLAKWSSWVVRLQGMMRVVMLGRWARDSERASGLIRLLPVPSPAHPHRDSRWMSINQAL
jgi:hypothetical protein